MGELHERFLNDSSPTDVITFDGDAESHSAGEICVCPDIAAEYAADNQLDFSAELALYIMHGYLHLCGLDDTDSAKRKRMREAEQVALKTAGEAGSIPAFSIG